MTLVALGRTDLGITDESQVHETLARHAPDLFINAAAYYAGGPGENRTGAGILGQRDGPHVLAAAVATLGLRLIHISADFVFSGERLIPYGIRDAAEPGAVYGPSKLAGEQAIVSALHSRAVVARTSRFHAAAGSNFASTVLRLVESQNSVGMASYQISTPTWSASLAEAVWGSRAAARRQRNPALVRRRRRKLVRLCSRHPGGSARAWTAEYAISNARDSHGRLPDGSPSAALQHD
jgi:dTDP-4-dehydrorhamnose reductase